MAEYFTKFSCLLPVDPGNAKAALSLYEQMQAELDADGMEIGFKVEQNHPDDGTLWLWDGDGSGDVENVISFALRAAASLDLAGLWGFHWALTCSKARPGSFGGGAQLLDLGRRGSLGWVDCQHWLEQRIGMGEPRTVLAEMILEPVAAAQGWTPVTQVSVLLGFVDSLIAADPTVAGQLRSRLADVSATPDDMLCRECGEPVFVTGTGVSHHVGSGMDGIDHDRDCDHVAIPDEEA